jgi:hypothetical protein
MGCFPIFSNAVIAKVGRITSPATKSKVKDKRAVAQTHRLPFDRLRASGGVLKSFDFSVHAELVEA